MTKKVRKIPTKYKVTKNGDTMIVTSWFKNASTEYDRCIYNGKPNDIICLYSRVDVESPWELARKDWL